MVWPHLLVCWGSFKFFSQQKRWRHWTFLKAPKMMPATAYKVPMASFEARWVDHATPATPSDGVVTITHTQITLFAQCLAAYVLWFFHWIETINEALEWAYHQQRPSVSYKAFMHGRASHGIPAPNIVKEARCWILECYRSLSRHWSHTQ